MLLEFAFNFNLRHYNKDGSDAGPGGAKKEDDDKERAEMRVQIQGALQKRYADQLSNVTYAASEGDVETVKTLMHRGQGLTLVHPHRKRFLRDKGCLGGILWRGWRGGLGV